MNKGLIGKLKLTAQRLFLSFDAATNTTKLNLFERVKNERIIKSQAVVGCGETNIRSARLGVYGTGHVSCKNSESLLFLFSWFDITRSPNNHLIIQKENGEQIFGI